MRDAAYNDLFGLYDPNRGSKGLNSRCSRCNAPSVTNQKGYQRCEQCWDDDATEMETQCDHGFPRTDVETEWSRCVVPGCEKRAAVCSHGYIRPHALPASEAVGGVLSTCTGPFREASGG